MLHGRAGQHDAELGQAVGEAFGKRKPPALAKQDDRPLRRGEKALLDFVDLANGASRLRIAHHHREGLPVTALAVPQTSDCLGVSRVANQMEPTEALHSDDTALAQQLDGAGEDFV